MACSTFSQAQRYAPNLPDNDAYHLVFQDEFDGQSLDWEVWDSDDTVKKSPSGQRTYRGKTNVLVEDGLLKLMVRKESQRKSEWTAAFVWLKQTFGANTYYESRFTNTDATGINNAFWMASRTSKPTSYANRYEIDCPENKVHTDGTVHSHLAWHDWKTIAYLKGKHIAQGFGKKLRGEGPQTWGLWVGETEFAIYFDGALVWDGKTHRKYGNQFCSGVGKLPSWNPQEEKRAYGKYGQDDWCYFGGMNGDRLNVCFSTIPWQSKGTPLTEGAHGAHMDVDYLRIFKRKSDLNTRLQQAVNQVTPGERIILASPVDLSGDGTSYFSFLVKKKAACDVSLSLLTQAGALSTLRLTDECALEIDNGAAIASSVDSHPAADRIGSSFPVGLECLVVVRITEKSNAKDIVSCKVIGPDAAIPEHEPFLYHNLDDQGNTSFTTEWDLSQKLASSDSIQAVSFAFDDSQATTRSFRAASNYIAVVHEHVDYE